MDVDDGVLVTVEAGELTDVIEDGTIAWRRSFVLAPADTKLDLGIGEDEAESIGSLKEPLGSYAGGKLEYSSGPARGLERITAHYDNSAPHQASSIETTERRLVMRVRRLVGFAITRRLTRQSFVARPHPSIPG
jgi:hypothetical protein